jgi:biopolymer transport protein ExbD
MAKRVRREEEAFQMAPMIDMVFLLLVFFMTVSTLAKEARPELELAYSQSATVPEATDPRAILTIVPGEGDFKTYWFNRQVNAKELEALLEENEGRDLLVRAPADLPWRVFAKVLQPLRRSGISEATFATFEK